MLEASFQCVLELFGGGGVLIAGLGVDGLPEMQDHLGLFGLLEGNLAGASHDGREVRGAPGRQGCRRCNRRGSPPAWSWPFDGPPPRGRGRWRDRAPALEAA